MGESSLDGSTEEFALIKDLAVNILEFPFEVEGGLPELSVADDADAVALISRPRRLKISRSAEGHLQPAVAAGNGAFDRYFSEQVRNTGQRQIKERRFRRMRAEGSASSKCACKDHSALPHDRRVRNAGPGQTHPAARWLETALFTAMAVNAHSP